MSSSRPHRAMSKPALHLLLVLLLLASACAPAQRIYSLDPVTPNGEPLRLREVQSMRLEDGQLVRVDGALELQEDRLVREDGSSWPVGAVHSIDYVDERAQLRRIRVESPADLLDFEELPRITHVRLRDGREFELGEDNPWSRWTEDRLGITISADGSDFEEIQLSELHSVTLYQSNLMESTVQSWRFWAVGAGAAILVYVISTRSEENQAVR